MWDNSYKALCKILHYYKKGKFLSFSVNYIWSLNTFYLTLHRLFLLQTLKKL